MDDSQWFTMAQRSLTFARLDECHAIRRAYKTRDWCEFGRLVALVVSRNNTAANLTILRGKECKEAKV